MNNFEQFEGNQKLPNDPLALILGIGSILFGVLGCCCGFFTVVPGMIIAIVGWIFASKDLKTYSATPKIYNLTSYNNTKTAKILNIIGLVICGIIVVLSLLWLVGVMTRPEFLEDLRSQVENMQDSN